MRYVFIKENGKRTSLVWDEEHFSLFRKKRQAVLRFPGEVRIYRVIYADDNAVVCDSLIDIKKLIGKEV